MQDDTDLTPMLEEMWAHYYSVEIAEQAKNGFEHPDFEFIQDEGGSEGEGDTGVIVFKWKGKFYEFTCYYDSNEGRDYDNSFSTLREVFPVQRMVTFYEGKPS